MAVLSQLIQLPELGLRLIQAGPGDPELSWASTTELLDLSGYLEGGEVVLTTGLALEAHDSRWRDFVAALSRARVAAIGFGVGVNHERTPPPLIAAASTYRVALFEVPPPVPFIAVSKAVAELLHVDDLRGARLALQVHQRLLDGARSPQSTAAVLASIAQATDRQLAVAGADGSIIASTAGFSAAWGASTDTAANQSVGSGQPPGGSTRMADAEVSIDEATGTRLLVAGGEALGPEGQAVVAAGAMVLGLELRGERVDEERERSRWSRLTEGLLSGRLDESSVALLDPELTPPESVRAVAALGSAEAVAAWRRRPRAGIARLVTGAQPLRPATRDAPDAPDLRPPSANPVTAVAVAWQLCPDDENLHDTLNTVTRHGLDAIVGRPTELTRVTISQRSAAARIDALSPVAQLYVQPRTPTVIWADRAAPILDSLLAAPTPHTLSSAVLGSLSDHIAPADENTLSDEDHQLLRATLHAFLQHNGQRGPAAASLGIHRNTLRDRLTRIERLLDRALDNPDDRAELWLALRSEGFQAS